jgi:hypothetical protein
MSLLRQWGATEGHTPLPPELLPRAFVAGHRRQHPCQARSEEGPGLRGGAVRQERQRALQGRQAHGARRAFAVAGPAGGEDFLRKLGRGIRPERQGR